jgi:glycosyltransferase involved in cell wall biosynthesis
MLIDAGRTATGADAQDARPRPTATGATRLERVAFLGNYLPRQCGIATFTTDLDTAVAAEFPALDRLVVAMNDAGHQHAYPPNVRFAIPDHDAAAYQRAADFLNASNVDAVCIQHEYGIFGGRAGVLLLTLMRALRMPIVTTLHTVLASPDSAQKRVLDQVLRLSERVVVMSAESATLLGTVHGTPPSRVDYIPHGIPSAMFAPGDKARIGIADKTVLLTFGLLSPDKGIEHVIDAMPAIIAACPDTVYIVLGATHPHVLETAGEAYRLMLQARAHRLGVAGHLVFLNRFVTQDELAEFLAAADIYVTPYLNMQQSTSGTLAYALGAGKAVISTPYRYATEVLAENRGMLVPCADAGAIAASVIQLQRQPAMATAMRARAAAFGRHMEWGAVAQRYVASLTQAAASHADTRRSTFRARTLAEGGDSLPEIALTHLVAMTDDTGMLQHAAFSVPRYADGYCLDDNARAMLLIARLDEGGAIEPRRASALAARYLAFVHHAFDASSGRFRNFLTYDRIWAEPHGSDDSHGRAIWALGTVVGRARDHGRRSLASDLFHGSLPAMLERTSPRSWAYALLGIDEYLRAFGGDTAVEAIRLTLSEQLLRAFRIVSTPDWPWLEESVTYCNARIPQALLLSGHAMRRADLSETGLRALEWLRSVQLSPDGDFAPIGSNGFLHRGGPPASFDQQPVEACGMVAASLDAFRITGDVRWRHSAHTAFRWFLGGNHLRTSLYDAATGGCRDGLHIDRLNENQGAESTLSFLQALWDMHAAQRPDLS